jgi:hypothetical protein
MFRCWNCGQDHDDPITNGNIRALKNLRQSMIESMTDADEYQQGIIDGIRIAISHIGG